MKGKVEHNQIFFYNTDDLKCTAGHLKEIANKRYGSTYYTRNTIHSTILSRLTLSPKKFGSALKYNETLAWSCKIVDYKRHLKVKKQRFKMELTVEKFSLLGSISWSNSEVDRTDTAMSVSRRESLMRETLSGANSTRTVILAIIKGERSAHHLWESVEYYYIPVFWILGRGSGEGKFEVVASRATDGIM